MTHLPTLAGLVAFSLLTAPGDSRGALFAAAVVDYQPGSGATLTSPAAALGAPYPIVGEGSGFDAPLTPFNPPYEATHLAQIGEGGHLTLRLSHYTTSIGIFANAGIIDTDWPNGIAGDPVGSFGIDAVHLAFSMDGSVWTDAREISLDLPSAYFGDVAGTTPADFGKPHDLGLEDLAGKDLAGILAALDGSAGGTWLTPDLSGIGEIGYLRFSLPDDADPATSLTVEIDAVSIADGTAGAPVPVPEPGALTLLASVGAAALVRRRRKATPARAPTIALASATCVLAPPTAQAETLLAEDFATDPVAAGRAVLTGSPDRFEHSPGELVASYDLLKPHARIALPLARPLTEADTFTATLEFTLSAVDFDDFNLCQLSFGLVNQSHTGPRRTASPGDCWECLTVDYFPGAAYPSYTPTFVAQRPPGGGDALTSAHLKFPSGSESLIDDFGEIGTLPEGLRLRSTLHHDAPSRAVTLTLSDAAGGTPLTINSGGGADGDPGTVQLQLGAGDRFELDAFALLLWDHFQGGSATLTAHSIHVETAAAPPVDLLAAAFPEGPPEPVWTGAALELTYRRDLTESGFSVSAEHSLSLVDWSPVEHSVLSAGPGDEIRRVSVPSGYLRLRVTEL